MTTEKFTLTIEMKDGFGSPEDLAWALRNVANTVQGGTGTGKIRNLYGDFTGEFDIVKATSPVTES